MLENAFLIPLVPTISFVVILFFGKKFIGADRVHVVGIGALGLVWILSAVAAFSGFKESKIHLPTLSSK